MNARFYFVALFIANIALNLISWAMLPDRVAIHFGANGVPNGWASKNANLFFFLVLHVPIFLMFLYLPRIIAKTPPRLVSLPNRDYWLREERRDEAIKMLGEQLMVYGAALFLFLFFVGLLVLDANLSEPIHLNERIFLTWLALFLAFTGIWTWQLYRAFRIPVPDKEEESE